MQLTAPNFCNEVLKNSVENLKQNSENGHYYVVLDPPDSNTDPGIDRFETT